MFTWIVSHVHLVNEEILNHWIEVRTDQETDILVSVRYSEK